jgi:hypothetical protein
MTFDGIFSQSARPATRNWLRVLGVWLRGLIDPLGNCDDGWLLAGRLLPDRFRLTPVLSISKKYVLGRASVVNSTLENRTVQVDERPGAMRLWKGGATGFFGGRLQNNQAAADLQTLNITRTLKVRNLRAELS